MVGGAPHDPTRHPGRPAARRGVAAAFVATLVVVACGGGDDATVTTPPPAPPVTEAPATTVAPTVAPTTDAPEPTPAPDTTVAVTTTEAPPAGPDPSDPSAYAEAGPYPVGVATLTLPEGSAVEVWYPAAEGTTGTVSYDVRDFTPDIIRELLTGDSQAIFTIDGARDAIAADGRFPVVLFSHGFMGMRVQSSFLTSHLASHGLVVVSPDHPSRDLENVLGGTAAEQPTSPVDELLGALELIVAEGDAPDGPFSGRIDGDRVGALGHSAGGGTVLVAASDPRVRGYVSMASGGPLTAPGQDPGPDVEFPDAPSFFLAGAVDEIVPADVRTRPAHEAAFTPSWYWEIDAAGHNAFNDFCTLGGGTGIIGLAEESGLGGFLEAQPRIRTLGEDGCIPPAAPVEQAFPIIRHGVTAWLRWLLDEDPELVGFGPEVSDAFDLAVTTSQR